MINFSYSIKKPFALPAGAVKQPTLGYTPRAVEIGLASLAINILSLALTLVTMQVYDRILVYKNISTLNVLCLGATIAVCVEATLKLMRGYLMGFGATAFEHTVACNAVRQTLAQDTNATEKLGIGEYLQRISAITKIRDFYSGQALATLIDLPFIFIFLTIIAYLGGVLVLVPVLLLVVMFARAFALGSQLKQWLKRRDKADDARYNFLIQTLTGIHTVKSFGLEAPFERRYEHWQSRSTRANYEVARLSAAAYDQGVISSHVMMMLVVIIGAPMVLHGTLTLGALIACVMLSGRIMQPVQKALGFWTRLQDIELAHQKLTAHFLDEVNNEPLRVSKEKEGRVELENVSFSYEGQEALLKGISLKLTPGEAIAISGDHGAGKQTLLKLIAGQIAPTEGSVLVNGIAPHEYTSEQLVEHVGYLPPVGVIFKGTIEENLSRFGHIANERVREMSALMGLEYPIASLPAGFETKLEGGHSDTIPPGLRQRIAIARVLAAKPRVLLFYNADRALDKEGYNCIYRLLARLKGRVTMVLVSNDQNILRLADRHYQLENGVLGEHISADASGFYEAHAYKEIRL